MTQEEAARFAEENMKTIFAWSLSRVSHKQDAEDLAGDIITAILESAPRVRDPDAFFGYVWTIANNTYKNFLRRRGRNTSVDIDGIAETASDDSVEDDVIRADETHRLRRELALLSREYRLCTIAHYFDGLSCAEIADKYSISLEMVKYYLYKTRKILKEGIIMEREFGEKSYRPAEFHFAYTYDGMDNSEYRTLFNRRLPGNILLAAYYTPMSESELSVELGVASAYVEDEIRVLEKYGLLMRLPSGKYQTKLVIFTREFFGELMEKTQARIDETSALFGAIREKLPEIRALGFRGCGISDERLLWALGWAVIHKNGWEYGESRYPNYNDVKLYRDAFGVSYGCDFTLKGDEPFTSNSTAGRHTIKEGLYLSYICSGVIPEKNRFREDRDEERIISLVEGGGSTPFAVVTEEQLWQIWAILADADKRAGALYALVMDDAVSLMKTHAPECVRGDVERVLTLSLLGEIVSILFYDAVNAGALLLPPEDDSDPLAFFAIVE